jgi:hypothetical protein
MHNVAKHYPKHKWECNARKETWIGLFISWNAIGLNDLLSTISEVVDLEQSWVFFSIMFNQLSSW